MTDAVSVCVCVCVCWSMTDAVYVCVQVRDCCSLCVCVQVHGGTTGEDIMNKVREAEKVAQRNAAAIGHRPVYTVLFFDEANTTEAVGVIKEVMCDGTLDGQQITLSQSLKMVAACNPYRK